MEMLHMHIEWKQFHWLLSVNWNVNLKKRDSSQFHGSMKPAECVEITLANVTLTLCLPIYSYCALWVCFLVLRCLLRRWGWRQDGTATFPWHPMGMDSVMEPPLVQVRLARCMMTICKVNILTSRSLWCAYFLFCKGCQYDAVWCM